MPLIFVSYRRRDSSGWAGRLVDRLRHRFGEDEVFVDVDNIKPGVAFPSVLDKAIRQCRAMLVVIGPHWNARRLADSEDYVRLEIAAALEHRKHLIPVLVGGAIIPTKSAIPQDICAMADQSAQEVLDSRWDHDVKELISTLERLLGWPAPRPDATGKSRRGFSGKAIAGASFLPFNLAIGPSPLDVIMYLVINIAALALGTIAVYDTRHGRLRGRWLATLVTGAGLIQLGVIPIAWLMQR